jgi:uncharacterized Zn finger protein
MSRWDYFDHYFPPSVPRQAKGGIRAQSKRGGFGESWWAKRWIAVLESFDIGARLQRGRRYARQGQVLSIKVEKGLIKARVQGSRPTPYDITIKVKALKPPEWKKVATILSAQALFAAKLLAGEMPQEIEQVFGKAGLSLFPGAGRDLTTDCSCPDWSNPCKHIAAVYYLLGEEFDRDPFLIFKMRGMSREEFLELLGHSGEKSKQPRRRDSISTSESRDEPAPTTQPLPADPGAFWAAGKLADDSWGNVDAPSVHAVPLRRLGKFPFWRGRVSLLEALVSDYTSASERGLRVWLGEQEKEGRVGDWKEALDGTRSKRREEDGQTSEVRPAHSQIDQATAQRVGRGSDNRRLWRVGTGHGTLHDDRG